MEMRGIDWFTSFRFISSSTAFVNYIVFELFCFGKFDHWRFSSFIRKKNRKSSWPALFNANFSVEPKISSISALKQLTLHYLMFLVN